MCVYAVQCIEVVSYLLELNYIVKDSSLHDIYIFSNFF